MAKSIYNQALNTTATPSFTSVNGVALTDAGEATDFLSADGTYKVITGTMESGSGSSNPQILNFPLGVDLVTVDIDTDSSNNQMTFTNDASSTNAIAFDFSSSSVINGQKMITGRGTFINGVGITMYATDSTNADLLVSMRNTGDTQSLLLTAKVGGFDSIYFVRTFYDGSIFKWMSVKLAI